MLLFNHSKFNILKINDTTNSFIFKHFFIFYQPLTTFNIPTSQSPSTPCHYWSNTIFSKLSVGKIFAHTISSCILPTYNIHVGFSTPLLLTITLFHYFDFCFIPYILFCKIDCIFPLLPLHNYAMITPKKGVNLYVTYNTYRAFMQYAN